MRTSSLAAALACLTLANLQAAAPDLTADNIDDVVAATLPTPAESAWLKIPWQTDLTAARKKAAKEDKPIFLWEMDGHPLGCT